MAKSKKSGLKKKLAISELSSEPEVNDEEDLMNDLFAQLDPAQEENKDPEELPSIPLSTNKAHSSKVRHLARKARKAIALTEHFAVDDLEADARRQEQIQAEQEAIQKICDELHVQIHPITPDGHCLFSALADQLSLLGMIPASQASHSATRLAAATYMLAHPDDFLPFLSSSKGDLMTPTEYQAYCASIRDTASWGGEPEILALCRSYRVPIHVIQASSPPIVTHTPGDGDPTPGTVIQVSYHRHMYGLGEHYNSLRPKSEQPIPRY